MLHLCRKLMKILIYKPYFLSQQENSHLSGKTDQTEKKKKKSLLEEHRKVISCYSME